MIIAQYLNIELRVTKTLIYVREREKQIKTYLISLPIMSPKPKKSTNLENNTIRVIVNENFRKYEWISVQGCNLDLIAVV